MLSLIVLAILMMESSKRGDAALNDRMEATKREHNERARSVFIEMQRAMSEKRWKDAYNLNVKVAERGEFSSAKSENINFNYELKPGSNKLKISCDEPYSGISAIVKVLVTESSHEVLQNLYPDRSLWTGIVFNNVSIEHDQSYIDEEIACAKRIKQLNDQYAKSRKLPHLVDPGPKFGVDVIDVIDALMVSNPTAANAVINEVARLGNVRKKQVIEQLR